MAVPFGDMALGGPVQGMWIAAKGEMLGPGQYLYLRNTRSLTPTTLEARRGFNKLFPTAITPHSNIHTLRRLNDYTADQSALVIGALDAIYVGQTSTTPVLGGTSGFPNTMVQMRPDQSPAPFMYIGDSSLTAKVGFVNGVAGAWTHGIEQAQTEARFTLGGEPFKIVDNFNSAASWTNNANFGALSDISRVSTTISTILYDSGSSGYACVQPTAFSDALQAWMLLTVGTETVKVHSVYPAIPNTTISSISYDVGSAGMCSIVLTSPSAILKQDALIRLDSGGATDEFVRVLAIVPGPDGTNSIRCSTVRTHTAGQTITGINSFRAYFTALQIAGAAITAAGIQTTSAGAGNGSMQKNIVVDLSTINNRPIGDDDDLHLSFRTNLVSAIGEIQILFDVASSGTAFESNYYIYSIRPNDINPAVTSPQTVTLLQTQQQIINNNEIDAANARNKAVIDQVTRQFQQKGATPEQIAKIIAGPAVQASLVKVPGLQTQTISTTSTVETATGNNQWSEIVVKFGDCIRVGPDQSRTWKDVRAVKIAVASNAAATMAFDSLWIGGTYNPDTRESGFGYRYTFRYRGRSTGGAKSNPAPPTRAIALPNRETITVSGSGSSNAQVDTVDVFRFGGTSSTWQYMGSVNNTSSWSFLDTFSDGDLANAEVLEFDNFKPWPTTDLPRSGTCNVKGTSVERIAGGDNFNTRWSRASVIRIGNASTLLFTSPTSSDKLEIQDNLGTQNGVRWEVLDGTLLNTPLRTIIGPYTESGGEYMFGLGDGSGNLMWTKSGQPEMAPDTNFVVVTSPSEPLVGGVMYDGRVFVWSTERMFFVVAQGPGQFATQEVANGKGLYSPWAVAVNQLMYFMAKDGFYESEGGEPRKISDPIHNLFANESATSALQVEGLIYPLSYNNPEDYRVFTYGNYVYFSYGNTNGEQRTLVWDITRRGWVSDDTYPVRINCYYGLEGNEVHTVLLGAANGFIYQFGGANDDDGSAISGIILSPSKFFEWWRHYRSCAVARTSQTPTTLTVETDGVANSYTLPSTTGSYSNEYLPLLGVQTKSTRWRLDFNQLFRLYIKDCVTEFKQWPNSGPYQLNGMFS